MTTKTRAKPVVLQAKDLAVLKGAKTGSHFELPSFLAKFGEKTVAVCTDGDTDEFKEFALYWHGISLATVGVEFHADGVILEELA